MKLNETKKVDTNLYELNITVDGEQYAKALDASFKKKHRLQDGRRELFL